MPEEPTYEELEQRIRELEKAGSDLKRAKESLQESSELLSRLQELAHVGSWRLDLTTRTLAWSDEVYKIFGLKPQEFAATYDAFLDVVHPDDRSAVDDAYSGSIADGRDSYEIEHRIVRKDTGEVRHVFERCIHERDASGTVFRSTGMVQDITERKKAEADIRKNVNFTMSLLYAIPTPVFYKDKDGRYIGCNRAFTEVMGVTSDEIKGKTVYELWPSEHAEVYHRKDLELIQNPEHQVYEFEVRDKDGIIRPVLYAKGVFRDENGDVAGLLGAFLDITLIKQAEEEKRKALDFAAEQGKFALIGQVAGKMAHDFNNVLMGIMGNAQLAIMNCDDEEIKLRLERIDEFSQRGRDITNTLITFSKDQEPKQTCFRIEDKIELALKMLERDLMGIEISRSYKPGIPEILADAGMIQDSLVNIIQNSIHAMSKVETPTLYLEAYSRDDEVYIVVRDNGCGIPEEHRESVFTPSFTLKGTQDKTGSYELGIKGTGYGMSNVKKYIVEKHKGKITVDSKVGNGTRITIALKVIEGRLSSEEKKEMAKSRIYDRRRILLVEDEAAIADVQYQVLTREPFRHMVTIAVNGHSAMDMFDRNKFDAVSLDYLLPGNINGLDVYNFIREKDQTIPVMFISGNIEFRESVNGLKEKDPNLDHLSKPVGNLEYVSRINELIGKRIK